MFRTGVNFIDGIAVEVVRKRIRRINLHVGRDGLVHLSVPFWGTTIAEGEAFLRSKWKWVVATRARLLSSPAVRTPITSELRIALMGLLGELHGRWSVLLGEPNVTWSLRSMKTLWGSCNWRKRHVTYNLDLARESREQVEYVVVHELTHLRAHDHGPAFQALMNERLPDWKQRRRRLRVGGG